MWFDPQELEQAPRVTPPKRLPEKARELVENLEREQARNKEQHATVAHLGKRLSDPLSDRAVMGMPLLLDSWAMLFDTLTDTARTFVEYPDGLIS